MRNIYGFLEDFNEKFYGLAAKVFFDVDDIAGIGVKSQGQREIKTPLYILDPFGIRRLIKLVSSYKIDG